jgi:hypothetical protein
VYDVVTQHAANQNPAAVLNEVPSWPKLITSPERIATERYYDQGCYQAEIENLWQMACRLEQIPKLGDWVEYANVGRSAIVVHTITPAAIAACRSAAAQGANTAIAPRSNSFAHSTAGAGPWLAKIPSFTASTFSTAMAERAASRA